MQPLKTLTTVAGAPVAGNQNSLTIGECGPMLLQDVWFLEKLAHFDREVIPERRVRAKGSGAYGKLTVTHGISQYSKAKIFALVGKQTDLSMHTFSMINAQNVRIWAKFHFKSMQGIANYTDQEAGQIVARDRESSQRDLFEHIEQGDFPRWRMGIQVMSESQAGASSFNPFDLTKVWLHKEYPLIEVGILELNKNPENHFAEVEQSAFNPANVVPGIGFSPDKMLQGRFFSHGDTQRYRLGINHHQIPVNAPRCPYQHSFHRDGAMRTDGDLGPTFSYERYEPNRLGEFAQDAAAGEPPLALDGVARRYDHRADDDCYSQPGALFHLMSAQQKQQLFDNIARSIGSVPQDIQRKQVEHFSKADPAYGAGVVAVLGLS